MHIKIHATRDKVTPAQSKTLVIILPLLAKHLAPDIGLAKPLRETIEHKIHEYDFTAEKNKTFLLTPLSKTSYATIIAAGLGKRQDIDLETIRQAGGTTLSALRQSKAKIADILFDPSLFTEQYNETAVIHAFSEGLLLADYQLTLFKYTKPVPKKIPLTVCLHLPAVKHNDNNLKDAQAAIKKAYRISEATVYARYVSALPANKLTPTIFAQEAQAMGKKYDFSVTVLDRAAIIEHGMSGLCAVSQGSAEEPRFIIAEKKSALKNAPTYVIIGKGLTFDSGGICIKSASKMDEMKGDMSGAGAVLGALIGLSQQELPFTVIGLMPMAENMPSGSATKPGDIIQMANGMFVEIINTDAEGRLVLADALHYAAQYKPKAIIDLATLTHAVIVALGHHASGILGNNQELIDQLITAGKQSGEQLWQMPLWKEYHDDIKSDLADIKNVGAGVAGTIIGACFLENFVNKDTPWAHIDIAGTALLDKAKPYIPKGATGVGVRLLLTFFDMLHAR